LKELRSELRRINPKLTKVFTVANRRVSDRLVAVSRPKVAGLPSPGGQVAVGGLKSGATQKSARLILQGSNPTIRANVFGTLSHKVWGRHVSGPGPWLPWVGSSWSPEDLHGVGPAFKEVADNFAPTEYADALMDALKSAFPD
jgi:hypothetical protein